MREYRLLGASSSNQGQSFFFISASRFVQWIQININNYVANTMYLTLNNKWENNKWEYIDSQLINQV